MSWNDVKLAEVESTNEFPNIPVGTYKFNLLPGAKLRVNNFDVEELVAAAAIAEGPFAGRYAWLQYPDPTSINTKTGKTAAWSAQALKKLEIALGIEQNDGETPVEYLNRVASNGHASFNMDFGPSKNIRTGETEPRIEIKLFTASPAA